MSDSFTMLPHPLFLWQTVYVANSWQLQLYPRIQFAMDWCRKDTVGGINHFGAFRSGAALAEIAVPCLQGMAAPRPITLVDRAGHRLALPVRLSADPRRRRACGPHLSVTSDRAPPELKSRATAATGTSSARSG